MADIDGRNTVHGHSGKDPPEDLPYAATQDRDFFESSMMEASDSLSVANKRKARSDDEENDRELCTSRTVNTHGKVTGNSDTALLEAQDNNLNSGNGQHKRGRGDYIAREQETMKTPVNNYTLASEGQGVVILVKPLGENYRDLINDPLEISELLDSSDFAKADLNDIRINKRKAIISIELKRREPAVIEKLLTITKLGKWNIQCYLPNTDKYISGVIWPIHINADLVKVKEKMVPNVPTAKVIKLERLKMREGRDWKASSSIRVTFACSELPRDVIIGRSFYRVRPFVQQPVQCFKCQRLGHTSQSCRGRVRCLLCGEGHAKEVCPQTFFKCAGCGGAHKANSRECLMIQDAVQIEERKAEGQNHAAARLAVLQSRQSAEIDTNNNNTQQSGSASLLKKHIVAAEIHHSMNSQVNPTSRVGGRYPTYADMLSSTKRDSVKARSAPYTHEILSDRGQSTPQMVSQSTQTENSNMANVNDRTSLVEDITKEILQKLVGCLTEVFSSSINRESNATKQLLLKNIMRNYFGNDIPTSTADKVADPPRQVSSPPSRIIKKCVPRSTLQETELESKSETDENEVLSILDSAVSGGDDLSSSEEEGIHNNVSSNQLNASNFMKKTVNLGGKKPPSGGRCSDGVRASISKKQHKKKKTNQ